VEDDHVLEGFGCPMCGAVMRKGKVKVNLDMVLEDGSKWE
jgi:hypothetical protein